MVENLILQNAKEDRLKEDSRDDRLSLLFRSNDLNLVEEKVNEWAGIGNYLDFGARGYDSRVARFNSVDPLKFNFPGYSPYLFALNRPIDGYDFQGMRWENFNPKNVGVVVFGSVYIDGDARNKRLADPAIIRSYESAKNAGQNVIVAANWEELLSDLKEKGKSFKLPQCVPTESLLRTLSRAENGFKVILG